MIFMVMSAFVESHLEKNAGVQISVSLPKMSKKHRKTFR
jgi:hypothetical protein